MKLTAVVKKYFEICFEDKQNYISGNLLVAFGSILIKSTPIIYGLITDFVTLEDFSGAIGLIIILIILRSLGHLIKIGGDYFLDIVLINSFIRSRINYIVALQNMDYDYHTNKSSGSLISLAKRGEAALFNAVIIINNLAFSVLIEFIVAVVSLSLINLQLGLVVFIALFINSIIGYFLIKFNIRKRVIANEEDDRITGLTVDNMVGFETIKIFGQEEFERKRLRKAYQSWFKAQWDYIATFRVMDSVIMVVSGLATFLVLILGLNLVESANLTIGAFVSAVVFIISVSKGMNDIIFNFREIAKTYTDLEKFFTILNLEPQIKDPVIPAVVNKVFGEIEFNNISFNYPKSRTILNAINVKIRAGETVALVGKSGSGKTTFVRLLLRFYDPIYGEINLDNINIKEFNQSDLRKNMGLVPQDPVLFNDSIFYNIAYPKPESEMNEVKEAAHKAKLSEFIETLPNKYDTIVGERGIKLSGGQKQRLAIARVILENPPVVIFDEATSQLDSETEKDIQEAFDNLIKDKTTIIIAHRLSTVKNADRILVFDNGSIVEEGKHDELIEKSTIYKKLWQLQTDSYIDTD